MNDSEANKGNAIPEIINLDEMPDDDMASWCKERFGAEEIIIK